MSNYIYPHRSFEVFELYNDENPIVHTYGSTGMLREPLDALIACYLRYSEIRLSFNEIDIAGCRVRLEREKRIIKRKDGRLAIKAGEQSFWVQG